MIKSLTANMSVRELQTELSLYQTILMNVSLFYSLLYILGLFSSVLTYLPPNK